MARSFAGGNNVRVAPSEAFNSRADGTTLAFWIRTTQTNSNTGVMSNWNGSSRGGYGVLINNVAGQVAFVVNGGLAPGGNISTTGAAVNDGNWHHIAVTFDRTGAANNCRLYKDGVFSNQGTLDANWGQGGQTYIIGSAADGFWVRFTGDLAEWTVWDGKLSDDEIAALANGAPAGYIRPKKIQLYIPFLETLLDFGRNRFSVTNSGGSVNTKAHPRVRSRSFRSSAGSYVDARPAVRELAGAPVSIKLVGTRAGRPSHGQVNFGMPKSGRYTQSDYVPPLPSWKPKIIIAM